jgi:hypothetical protein
MARRFSDWAWTDADKVVHTVGLAFVPAEGKKAGVAVGANVCGPDVDRYHTEPLE